MSAGAASRGIQGACVRDQMQQVFSIDRRKWSCMGATNPWLLQPSMDCSQGGCRDAPTAVRKCEFRGPARDRTVTAIENPRRTLPQARTSPGHFRLRFSISCSVRAPAGPRKSGRYTAGPFNPFRATFQYTGTGLNIVYERALSANPRSSHHSYVHPRHNARSHKLAHADRALIARTCGPMKTLEEALGTVPVEGPARGAFVHAHAVKIHALAWHTYPAHDGAAAPKLARPLVDKHLHSHTCLVHPRLRYREPQVHGWGGGCGTRRAQIDAWLTTDIMGIMPASLAWAPQPENERNCRRHTTRTA